MAADTARKRYSVMNMSQPWRGITLQPASPVDAGARQILVFLYGGVLTPVVVTFISAWAIFNTLLGDD